MALRASYYGLKKKWAQKINNQNIIPATAGSDNPILVNSDVVGILKLITVSFTGGELTQGTFQHVAPWTVPEGYTPIAVAGYNLGRLSGYSITGIECGTAGVVLRGYATSAITGLNGSYYVLCIKSEYLSS